MTAALMTSDEQADFDNQDVFFEMRNGPHGEFINALGEAALRADPCNRRLIETTWPHMMRKLEAIVRRRYAELNK